MNIKNYGYKGIITEDAQLIARVTAVHKERYELVYSQGTIYGRLKTVIYLYGREEVTYPTVGDFVEIVYNELGDSSIVKTLPRRSVFTRLDPSSAGHGDQAVAANFDYVFILTSMNQDFNVGRLGRYLTAAWNSGGEPVVILTKLDLCENPDELLAKAEKAAPGINVFALSTATREGLSQVEELLKPEKTIVFLGSSGVGKSSLLNALSGKEWMETGDIREDDAKGRHTTTHRQLVMLPSGAMIIDTPGMRELGLWDAKAGLGEVFDDVAQYEKNCRFADCSHKNEPGCAVKKAIRSGELSESRLNQYQKLLQEAKHDERKATLKWHKTIKQSGRKKETSFTMKDYHEE